MYIYDEFVQQHRRLVSKLDLEERRRREAREKGEGPGISPPAPGPGRGSPGDADVPASERFGKPCAPDMPH